MNIDNLIFSQTNLLLNLNNMLTPETFSALTKKEKIEWYLSDIINSINLLVCNQPVVKQELTDEEWNKQKIITEKLNELMEMTEKLLKTL